MRLSSVRAPGIHSVACSKLLLLIVVLLLVPAGSARASHEWLDFTSTGRWRAARSSTAPIQGQDRRFELGDLNHDGNLDYVSNVKGGIQAALGNGDGTFEPLQYTLSGTGNNGSCALGDLNNDGNLDAVTADLEALENSVSVFLGNGSGGFGAPTSVPAGTGHRWIALGDVNQDGKLDLAYAGGPIGGPYTIAVQLGDGAGGFGAPTQFAETNSPSEMSLADLNGDGKLDLVWIATAPDQVSIRFGNGAGGFGAATRLQPSLTITDVQTPDVNGDGRSDVVWTCDGGLTDTTYVVRALAGGGFSARFTIVHPGDSEAIAAGDFNEDGKLDIVGLLKDSRCVYKGNGDGTFNMITAGDMCPGLPLNFGLTNVFVTDLNHDGHQDIVYPLPAVDLGIGNGSFGDAPALTSAAGPAAAVFAPIDADALPDLVVACRGTAMMSVFFNAGGGSFLTKRDFPIGSGAASICATDFNGDGRTDIATANQSANTVSVLLNNGANAFLAKADFGTGNGPVSVRAADLNGDGKKDLVVLNTFSATISVLIGNGAGSFATKVDYPVGNSGPTDLVVADFNNDSRMDVAVAGGFLGSPGILLRMGNGDGTLGAETSLEPISTKRALAVGDFNKDGKMDLAASNLEFTVKVFLGNGNGTFDSGTEYFVSSNAFSVEAADLDNDGNLDLLLGHSFGYFWALRGSASGAFTDMEYGYAGRGAAGPLFTSHQVMAFGAYAPGGRIGIAMVSETMNAVTLLRNQGPAIDPPPQAGWLPVHSVVTPADPRGLTVADFNRDGRRDAAAAAAGPNQLALHLGDGMGSFSAAAGFTACLSIRGVATGDLNRDGKADAVTVGSTGMISTLLGTGTGSFNPKNDVDSGGTSHAVAVGDFDGNGTLDIVSDDTGGSHLKAYSGSGTGTFGAAVISTIPGGSGCSGADIAVADINGDGKLDAVVATQGCGNVAYMQGNGAFMFTGTSLTMGTSPGHVVVGDFNSDGRPDLAVSDESNGQVVVRLQNPASPGTFLGATAFTATTNPGDLAAADVDQDGDLDIVVGSMTLASIAVLKNNGSGSFANGIPYPMTDPVTSLAVEDLNRDGLIDVVTTGTNGTTNSLSVRLGTTTIITGVPTPPASGAYALAQNNPNPFNPKTKIRFAIGKSEPVRLRVYDAGGRLVATLVNETMTAGPHEVTWTGRNEAGVAAASGVYFYKLEAGAISMSRRMVLLK